MNFSKDGKGQLVGFEFMRLNKLEMKIIAREVECNFNEKIAQGQKTLKKSYRQFHRLHKPLLEKHK